MRPVVALSSLVFVALLGGSCTPAHAQPVDVVVAEPPPTCNDGVVWHRSADITFCATPCTSDIDCASGERCRVLDEGQKPEDGALLVDDMHGAQAQAHANAHAQAALARAQPMFDEEPVCEGDCAPYTGDLQIRPSMPTALCDPFHDVAGAMLSEADEAAAAAVAD